MRFGEVEIGERVISEIRGGFFFWRYGGVYVG